MAQVMKDIVTWLKQWFYTEAEVDTLVGGLQSQINNKADTSDLNSKADKTNGVSQITDTSAGSYTNISTTLTNASTQAEINSAINTKIGTLMDLDWIVVVTTLPTASASTMGHLYLVAISGSADNNFKEYVTVESQGAYSWEKLGEISGSGLSVDWSDITNKPSSFTPSTHTHSKSQITDFPTIPSKTSDLTNDSGFISDVSGKADKTQALGVTITLVDKGQTNEGCIIFNTIS
jgi:hypothetical protein